ncbi:amidohydrolase family protein [Salinimicrobium oceani]|uniref:Amidohydrolase family protein n=1 Tax=Salinimicrobium oceani TaxID=2722702 RepID=A0ABX1D3F8_9FLAO|nr:amidohydrolase family protein [Salinimicrobium oceani]NJW54209.1 amidohydrolase family protein [Salinimicrobium oceani]
MRIDSHQHFWKYDPAIHSWIPDEMSVLRKDFQPQDLQPVLKKNDISGCVLVQAEQSETETVRLLKWAKAHSFIKGVVGWIDLESSDAGSRLKYFSKNSFFKGVRHTVWDEKGEFMTNPDFQRGVGLLAHLGLTFDILVFDYQLAAAVDLVKAFPRQKFVLDHLGKPEINGAPGEDWANNIAQLGECPNVWCKLSGLVTAAPGLQWQAEDVSSYLQVVTHAFGPHRIMFGSDWPVCLSAASFEEVLHLAEEFFKNFSKEEKDKIFGSNAIEFYNLK